MNRNVLRARYFAGAALAVGLALAGCGGNNTPAGGGDTQAAPLSGAVAIDGSSTVEPLTSAAADLFKETQAGVNVTVGTSGTGGGFEKFCKGETDISDASRKINDKEKTACETGNVKWTELQVANDALTVAVHKDNTWAKCLTVAQLKKIWEPAAQGKITNWNQVDPSFPNEPLKLFSPGTDSGTFDYFTAAINGKEGDSRQDATFSENDNVLVQGVSSTKGGLGYFGFSYFEENQSNLKAVEVDSGAGCVAPSLDSAQSGNYKPLARPLFIYVKQASMTKPQVKGFVEFYVTKIDEIVKEAAFVPLNATQKSALTAAWETLKSS
ncbi:MAG TPA: PstS family phosphate ABC transporter substrate-binding protein [Micromonosporaceae bacterium]|nr:PstS family phosphate ABC transporter substrate-binding protein [Micromonosporaceae bacterium]